MKTPSEDFNTTVILYLLFSATIMAADTTMAEKSPVTGRDGSLVAYENGIVADTRTGLEWFVGPDKDTSYYQAAKWVQNLTVAGGGWRMPTAKELRTIYSKPGTPSSITPLLKNTGSHMWSCQTDENLSLYLFRYMDPFGTRGFAVRSASAD